jgi:predicted helicase
MGIGSPWQTGGRGSRAVDQFRSRYHDPSITKWDIFHYVYAILHHPDYRQRYAANLRRELPRIPFIGTSESLGNDEPSPTAESSRVEAADDSPGRKSGVSQKKSPSSLPKAVAVERSSQATTKNAAAENKGVVVFHKFVHAGRRLAEIHVHYEQFLTLTDIPNQTYEYRLGNRSALEWIVDQYQISTDKRSGITNDPNRDDDPGYMLRLIGQIISVSLETVKIVRGLPTLRI